MRWALAVLAALSVCALMGAQSAPAPQGATPTQTSKPSPSPAENSAGGKLELRDIHSSSGSATSPPVLKDAVLKKAGETSTEDVARGVARELAKRKGDQTNSQGAGESQAKTQGAMPNNSRPLNSSQATTGPQNLALEPASSSDAVLEFQPAASGSGTASNPRVVSDDAQSKSPLKRVHGDLYGATGGAGHAAGGSVGATSKSGKTSIYVQSDDARSKAGQPQP
jgi:hypothetical protein